MINKGGGYRKEVENCVVQRNLEVKEKGSIIVAVRGLHKEMLVSTFFYGSETLTYHEYNKLIVRVVGINFVRLFYGVRKVGRVRNVVVSNFDSAGKV